MTAVLGISPRRVKGILLNNLYTLRHSPIRVAELFYWPFIEVVLCGFLSNYLRGRTDVGRVRGLQLRINSAGRGTSGTPRCYVPCVR